MNKAHVTAWGDVIEFGIPNKATSTQLNRLMSKGSVIAALARDPRYKVYRGTPDDPNAVGWTVVRVK